MIYLIDFGYWTYVLKKEPDMPVSVRKIGKNKYRVSTPNGVKSKGSTLANAKSQERLLNAVEHGWKPTGKKKKKRTSNKLSHQFGEGSMKY